MALYNYNKVILVGNLTRDPEVNYTQTGQAVTKFTIAVNRRFKTSSGEQKQETSFIPIEVWGRQAENCKEYLKKGRSALIEGSIRSDRWTGQDGTARSRLKIVAVRVQFLPTPSARGEGIPGEGKISEEVPKEKTEKPAETKLPEEAPPETEELAETSGEEGDEKIPF